MPKTTLIDTTGKEVKQIDLNKEIFGAKVNETLVAQAVRTRMHNAWLGTRKTKARGEVRGGGRKPWRQKGTGRARHGSIRSPIWVGGGHAHSLTPVDKKIKMPKKMRRQALFASLTDKLNQKAVKVVQKWEFKKPSTKDAISALDKIGVEGKVLIVTPDKSQELSKALNNVNEVALIEARLLHPYDILHCDTLIVLEESLSKMEETFLSTT